MLVRVGPQAPCLGQSRIVFKRIAPIRDLCMDRFGAPFLAGALRERQRGFGATVNALRLDLLPGGQRGKVFQSQIDANAALRAPRSGSTHGNLDHDVQEPVATRILGKVGAVLDFAFGQRSAVKHAKGVAGEAEGIAFALQFAAFQWHPAKVFLAAVAQARPLLLRARFSVLLADCVHRAGMQTKLFARALRELVKVKPGMPATTKAQSVFLPIVTKIPDEVARSGLAAQQAIKRFHPVPVDKNHTVIIYSFLPTRKASTVLQSAPFLLALNGEVSRSI